MPLFGSPNIEKLKAKRNIKALVKVLMSSKWGSERDAAAKALGEIGDPRSVEPLIAAFKINRVSFYTVRKELVRIGYPAVDPLICALNDSDIKVRQLVTEVLAEIPDKRALESLIIALNDEQARVRGSAARALGGIGDPRAVNHLIESIKDSNSFVREHIADSLDKLGWQADQSEAGAAYWVAKKEWDKCVEIGALAVDSLIIALEDENEDISRPAAEALGKIGDTRAVAPLSIALKDRRMTYYAANALGEIGGPAVDTLINALNDWGTCLDATLALGVAGDARAVEPLISFLESANVKIRQSVANALGAIGDDRAVEPLIDALLDSESSPNAAGALGKIGDTRAVEPLIDALKSKNERLRQAAAEALGRIGDARALEPLVATLKVKDWSVLHVAADALDKFDWQVDHSESGAAYWIAKQKWDKCVEIGILAVEPLISALDNPGVQTRDAAAIALGEIGDVRAIFPLMDAQTGYAIDALVKIEKARKDELPEETRQKLLRHVESYWKAQEASRRRPKHWDDW